LVKFLTTIGISNAIETIIRKARKQLVIVSPYLKLSKSLLERLQNADERVDEIIFIYGKEELKDEERGKLLKLTNLKLYFREDLHAKCYFNETQMVISSMNLYESNGNKNREMGLLITRDHEEDITIYDEAIQEVIEIIKSEDTVEKKTKDVEEKETKIEVKIELQTKETGFCIRCHDQIKYNPKRPYCNDCYTIWVEYNNPDYIDSYCHRCGKYNDSTKVYPLCNSCYKKG